MNKWIEHNKSKFSTEIKSLETIISGDVRAGIQPNQFTSDMLVALKSGRKITPKMHKHILKIMEQNSSEYRQKKQKWVNSVVPKILMVMEMVKETNWKESTIAGKKWFLESIRDQAIKRASLSKKQMMAVDKIYKQCNKNIEKNKRSK